MRKIHDTPYREASDYVAQCLDFEILSTLSIDNVCYLGLTARTTYLTKEALGRTCRLFPFPP